jgi:hypothetical protein
MQVNCLKSIVSLGLFLYLLVTVSGVLLRYHYQHAYFYFSSDPQVALALFVASCLLAMSWCVSIPLSRMYVGVHSPLDVVGGNNCLCFVEICLFQKREKNPGFSFGVVFLLFWLWFYPHMYEWITVSRFLLVPTVCLTAFLAVTIHPRSNRPSPSFRNNVAVIGIIVGTFLGLAYRQVFGVVLCLKIFHILNFSFAQKTNQL